MPYASANCCASWMFKLAKTVSARSVHLIQVPKSKFIFGYILSSLTFPLTYCHYSELGQSIWILWAVKQCNQLDHLDKIVTI